MIKIRSSWSLFWNISSRKEISNCPTWGHHSPRNWNKNPVFIQYLASVSISYSLNLGDSSHLRWWSVIREDHVDVEKFLFRIKSQFGILFCLCLGGILLLLFRQWMIRSHEKLNPKVKYNNPELKRLPWRNFSLKCYLQQNFKPHLKDWLYREY